MPEGPPSFKTLLPRGFRRLYWALQHGTSPTRAKWSSELAYWREQWSQGRFDNSYYQHLMLAIAGETSPEFLAGQCVADFGCGPQGSLCWAKPARMRIGIDVLADRYSDFGIAAHDMCYVRSSETGIPLPSAYVDVVFTVNALDHVERLGTMCSEILRILRPGGELIGSFNIDEPPTVTEPQTLTEGALQEHLLRHLRIVSRRSAAQGPPGNRYQHFDDGSLPPPRGPRFVWVRGVKDAG